MKALNKNQNNIYNGNVKILKKRFPHVIQKLDQCQTRDPFLAHIREDNGHRRPTIHIRLPDNRTAPLCDTAQFEALLQRIANTKPPEPFDMVFILGMGLGEAGLTAVRQYQKKPRIVVIEPYPSLFKLALSKRPLDQLLNYNRLELYIGNQAKPNLIIDDCKKNLPVGHTFLFVHPYEQQLIGRKYKQLQQNLFHEIRSFRNIWFTAWRFGRKMMANAFENLPSLLTGTPLRVLKNRLKSIPIICVAAGPSLDQALPLLKGVKNALILACDSAVGSLLHAGIQPHIVVTADFHESNFEKLKPFLNDLHDTALAFLLEANPDIIKTFPGSRRVGMTAYNRLVLDWLDQPLQLHCQVPTMTSVTHLAILLSIALGGDPIIMVGVDMAYLNGKSHAHGSVSSHIPDYEKSIPVKSVDGGVVYAPPQLVTDRLIVEKIIVRHKVRVINVSMAGALVAGAEVKSFTEVIADDLVNDVDVRQILDAVSWDLAPDHGIVQSRLQQTMLRFKELKIDCHRQHNRITKALQSCDPRTGQKGLTSATKQIKKRYMTFKRKHRFILGSLRDLMLGDKQTLIKREEIAATTPTANRYQRMAMELELIKDFYGAITDSVAFLVDGLGATQSRHGHAGNYGETGRVRCANEQ